MRLVTLLVFFFIALVRSAADPTIDAFTEALVKFDAHYVKFKNNYCSIPEGASGPTPCILGDTFDYETWKAAREAAKKLFKLDEKK